MYVCHTGTCAAKEVPNDVEPIGKVLANPMRLALGGPLTVASLAQAIVCDHLAPLSADRIFAGLTVGKFWGWSVYAEFNGTWYWAKHGFGDTTVVLSSLMYIPADPTRWTTRLTGGDPKSLLARNLIQPPFAPHAIHVDEDDRLHVLWCDLPYPEVVERLEKAAHGGGYTLASQYQLCPRVEAEDARQTPWPDKPTKRLATGVAA